MAVKTPPKDKCNVVYCIMFLQGVGMLLPWNAFISANSYFHLRFQGTPFVTNFESCFSIAYTLANLLGLGVAVHFQHKLRQRTKIVYPLLIYTAVFLTTAVLTETDMAGDLLFGITTGCILAAGLSQGLLGSGVFGLVAKFPPAYTQAVMGGQGLAGLGVSLVGLLAAYTEKRGGSARKGGGPAGPDAAAIRLSAAAYFGFSTLVLVFCLVSYMLLERNPFARYYARHNRSLSAAGPSDPPPAGGRRAAASTPGRDDQRPLVSPGTSPEDGPRSPFYSPSRPESYFLSPVAGPPRRGDRGADRRRSSLGRASSLGSRPNQLRLDAALASATGRPPVTTLDTLEFLEDGSVPATQGATPPQSQSLSRKQAVRLPAGSDPYTDVREYSLLSGEGKQPEARPRAASRPRGSSAAARLGVGAATRAMAKEASSVFVVFMVTLALFPAVTSAIRSVPHPASDTWVALSFVLFNLGDFTGRTVAGKLSCVEGWSLLWVSLLRLGFVPLFLFCNVRMGAASTSAAGWLPYVFDRDLYPALFMALFAFSNGYIGTLCMMRGPMAVPPEERKLGGTLMAFFLTFGLATGAGVSFGLHALLCRCNPFLGG